MKKLFFRKEKCIIEKFSTAADRNDCFFAL